MQKSRQTLGVRRRHRALQFSRDGLVLGFSPTPSRGGNTFHSESRSERVFPFSMPNRAFELLKRLACLKVFVEPRQRRERSGRCPVRPSPKFRAISFVGSTPVCQACLHTIRCQRQKTHASGQGGAKKNHVIVLPDAEHGTRHAKSSATARLVCPRASAALPFPLAVHHREAQKKSFRDSIAARRLFPFA